MADSRDSASPRSTRCGEAGTGRPTSRRVVLETLLGLGATSALYGNLDDSAWRAYEAVEEAWIRDRHQLLVQYAPDVIGLAHLDLNIKLADLRRRAMQFRHLMECDPSALRGGAWQLTALSASDAEHTDLAFVPEYRKLVERMRQSTEKLRKSSQYDPLQRAQVRLWKTPQYREIHRRYMGRMHELAAAYGGSSSQGFPSVGGH